MVGATPRAALEGGEGNERLCLDVGSAPNPRGSAASQVVTAPESAGIRLK